MSDNALTSKDIDATINAPSEEKSNTRKKIDEAKDKFMRGEGIAPKIVGGIMAIPAALSHIKPKDAKTTQIPL